MPISYVNIKNTIRTAYNAGTMEVRLFNLSLLILAIVSILASCMNIALGVMSALNYFMLILGFATFGVLYLTLFKNGIKYFKIPALIVITCLLCASWFLTQGLTGSTILFLPILLIISIYLNHHKYAYIIVLFFVVLSIALLLVEIYSPQLITPYPSSHEQYIDLASSFIFNMICIGLILLFTKRSYDRERNFVIAQKQDLERYVEEIYLQNERIIEQNELLELQNKELKELNKTKDVFLSLIGHDLKNPIGVIIGFSELLNSNINSYDKDKIAQFLKHIEDSSRQVYMLLENLLAWANCQTGKIQFKPNIVSISELASNSCMLIREIAVKKDIQIIFTSTTQKSISCDSNMIDTIMRNLLSNSVKFTPLSGRITVTVSEQNDEAILISIQDTGVGMLNEQIAAILERKEISPSAGTNNEKGTGIGLSLCHEFLLFHQTKLQITSKLHQGSCFSFSLPFELPPLNLSKQ